MNNYIDIYCFIVNYNNIIWYHDDIYIYTSKSIPVYTIDPELGSL